MYVGLRFFTIIFKKKKQYFVQMTNIKAHKHTIKFFFKKKERDRIFSYKKGNKSAFVLPHWFEHFDRFYNKFG